VEYMYETATAHDTALRQELGLLSHEREADSRVSERLAPGVRRRTTTSTASRSTPRRDSGDKPSPEYVEGVLADAAGVLPDREV
jgi:hypothetical protein